MKNTIIFLFAAFFTLQSCAPAKLLRTPTAYRPGYSVSMQQRTETETLLTVFGEEKNQTSSNTTEYEYRVIDVLPDGRLSWEMKITRFITEDEQDGGESSYYDSNDPDRDTSDLKIQMLEKMKGHSMKMTTSQDGRILAFTGADELFDRMFETLSSKPEMGVLLASVKKSYGDSAMIETVQSMWGDFPKKAIRVGDSWKTTKNNTGLLGIDTKYTYKLKSRDAKKAVVNINIEASHKPGAPAVVDMGVMKIIYELSGKGSGTMDLSQPDGMLLKSKSNITLKGDMKMSGEHIPAMTVPITSKTTVITERIK